MFESFSTWIRLRPIFHYHRLNHEIRISHVIRTYRYPGQHVFNNQQHPGQSNVLTYFYRMEFQSLVWVKDLSLIRANLLHASIPWGNTNDAFLVADTQKSSSSCLPLCQAPDSFLERPDGRQHLQFH